MEDGAVYFSGEEAISWLMLRPKGWLIDRWDDLSEQEVTLFREDDPEHSFVFRFSPETFFGVALAHTQVENVRLVGLSERDVFLEWVEVRLRTEPVNPATASLFEEMPDSGPAAGPHPMLTGESFAPSHGDQGRRGKFVTRLFGAPVAPIGHSPPNRPKDDDSWDI